MCWAEVVIKCGSYKHWPDEEQKDPIRGISPGNAWNTLFPFIIFALRNIVARSTFEDVVRLARKESAAKWSCEDSAADARHSPAADTQDAKRRPQAKQPDTAEEANRYHIKPPNNSLRISAHSTVPNGLLTESMLNRIAGWVKVFHAQQERA